MEGCGLGRRLGACEAAVIEHGTNGLLVDSGDTQGLSDAVGGLLDNPGMRVRLGKALQERVSAVFGWPAAYEKYEQLIDDAPVG